jgi:DNA-binding LytR/AlgR family response regulator
MAVDDEKIALDLLADNIKRVPYLNLIASCKNAMDAAEVLKQVKIDILFIDIQMPGISGLQFVKSLVPKPLVIFVTAFENYALNAFNVDAIDYLVKPVVFERFLQATNKALLFFGASKPSNGFERQETEFIFINVEYQLVKLVLADLLYIEGLKDYIKIFIRGTDRPLLTRLTLKSLEDLLPTSKFIRTHRSYIVPIASIQIITKDSLILHNNQLELPIGDAYRDNINLLAGRYI